MGRSKEEDAGGLTPVKDDNAAARHFDRRTLLVFKCVDYKPPLSALAAFLVRDCRTAAGCERALKREKEHVSAYWSSKHTGGCSVFQAALEVHTPDFEHMIEWAAEYGRLHENL